MTEEKRIIVYHRQEQATSSFSVLQLSENIFKMTENDIINYDLTYGTEIKTMLGRNGEHEIVKILKRSPFSTRRFWLTSQFTESEYRLLGDEIVRQGGFWQVDLGKMATINLPQDTAMNIDHIFNLFGFDGAEII